MFFSGCPEPSGGWCSVWDEVIKKSIFWRGGRGVVRRRWWRCASGCGGVGHKRIRILSLHLAVCDEDAQVVGVRRMTAIFKKMKVINPRFGEWTSANKLRKDGVPTEGAKSRCGNRNQEREKEYEFDNTLHLYVVKLIPISIFKLNCSLDFGKNVGQWLLT